MSKLEKRNHKEELILAEKELGIESEKTDKIGTSEKMEMEEIDSQTQVKLSDNRIIDFNTDIMTGRIVIELKDKYFVDRKRKAGLIADLDDYFFIMAAEKMSGIKLREFMDLKVKDFRAVVTFVRNFLIED